MTAEPATLAACLTPPGRGALATVAVRGPRAWAATRALFRPISAQHNPLPPQPESGRFWLGRLGTDVADEVVLAVPRATETAWVEVHCHGGPEAVRLVLEAFAAQGVEVCTWQALERRTAPDPAAAVVAAELVQAPTARTAAVLLDQYRGAFAQVLQTARAALARADEPRAAKLLSDLVRYAPVGRHLTQPWRVAVVGPPNVGKSSLVNALAGFPRCVVSATPGTTRDLVTALIAVEGWPVELTDTAGVRPTAGGLEAAGISQARSAAADADLCLWVLDASEPPAWPDFAAPAMHYVINKTDLPPAWSWDEIPEAVRVSAKTGAGLTDLCRQLAAWLVPAPPPPGAAVPFTPLLCDHVEAAHRAHAAGQCDTAARLLAGAWQGMGRA